VSVVNPCHIARNQALTRYDTFTEWFEFPSPKKIKGGSRFEGKAYFTNKITDTQVDFNNNKNVL